MPPAPAAGGGLWGRHSGDGGEVINCLISDNNADAGYEPGGTGWRRRGAVTSGTVRNCLIAGNWADSYGGGVYMDDYGTTVRGSCKTASSSTTRPTCPARGSTSCGRPTWRTASYTSIPPTTTRTTPQARPTTASPAQRRAVPGPGNIAADPQFLAPWYADYRLRPGSACVGAGTNLFSGAAGEMDLAGNPRLLGAKVDIGACEQLEGPLSCYVTVNRRRRGDPAGIGVHRLCHGVEHDGGVLQLGLRR